MAIKYFSPSGSTGNTGDTTGSPWPVSRLNNLSAGDTGYLMAGTYSTTVTVTARVGTAGAPIVITNYPDAVVVFNGGWNSASHPCTQPGVLPAGEYSSMVEFVNCAYIEVSGFAIEDAAGECLGFVGCDHITVENVTTDSSFGGSFVFNSTTNSTMVNCSGNLMSLKRNWRGQTTCGVANNNWQSCCFVGDDSNYVTIEGTTISNGGGEGLVAGRKTHHVTYRNCISYNNRANGVYLATTQDSVMDRILIYNTDDHRTTYAPENGVNLNDENQAFTRGATPSNRNTVRNCMVCNVGNGIVAWTKASLQNLTIENNTIVNCDYAIRILQPESTRPTPTGNRIRNNIFYNSRRAGTAVCAVGSGITWNNNLWFGVTRPANATGTGDIVGQNPLLEDPNAAVTAPFSPNKLRLTAGSPAISAAGATGATADYFGAARGSIPCIGAHEFGGVVDSDDIDERIATGTDDQHEVLSGGALEDITSVRLRVTEVWAWLRWSTFTLPAGVVIDSAYLYLTYNSGTGAAGVTIYGEKNQSPTTVSGTNGISTRPRTTASVAWTLPESTATTTDGYVSPDIKSIIQELVDSYGALTTIALVINRNTGGRTFEAYNSQPTKAARLVITYSTVETPTIDAAFTGLPATGGVPTTVSLTDTSTADGGCVIDSWLWEYNKDSAGWTTIGTTQNIGFTLTQAGSYEVRLTVLCSGLGMSDAASATIVLSVPQLTADFTWTRAEEGKALLAAANGDLYAGDSSIKRSTDGGATWSTVLTPGGGTTCYAIIEANGGYLAAFATAGAPASASGLYTSTNGTSWAQSVSNTNIYSLAKRQDGLVFSGRDGSVVATGISISTAGEVKALAVSALRTVVFADLYNVYRIPNGATTATPTEVESPYAPTVLLSRAGHADGPGLILGTQNDISVSWDDGQSWEIVQTLFQAQAGAVLADGSVLMAEKSTGAVWISRDGGLTYSEYATGFASDIYALAEDPDGNLYLLDTSAIYKRSADEGVLSLGPVSGAAVYVANKRTAANLTHLKVYDASATTYTTTTADAFANAYLFPSSPAVDDIAYIGVQSTVANAGPFHNLIVALSVVNQSIEYTIQYYDGSDWTDMIYQDNTGGLRRSGSIAWEGLTDWEPVAVDGVTAYWVRFVIDSVGSAVARPRLTSLYSATQPYIEVPAPAGDIDAIARLELIPQADGDLGYGINGAIIAVRTLSRGADFTPFFVMAESQNAPGITVSAGSQTAFVADVETAAAGQLLRYTPTTTGAWLTVATATIANADSYRGDFQLYARLKFTGDADTVQARGVVDAQTGEAAYLEPWSTLATGYAGLVHLGPFHIHDRRQFSEASAAIDVSLQLRTSAADAAQAVDIFELILMPADEWIGNVTDPRNETAAVALVVDSATFPKRQLRAYGAQKGTRFVSGTWRASATGAFTLAPGEVQRIWIVTQVWNGTHLGSPYPALYRAKLWIHERWLGLRGDE